VSAVFTVIPEACEATAVKLIGVVVKRFTDVCLFIRVQFIDRNLNPKKIKKTPKNGCLFNTACVP